MVRGVVDTLVAGGEGLIRTDDGVVFVPRTAPGDDVTVQITRQRGGVRHGEVQTLHTPSPQRAAPDCPVHDRCGGCSWLHLTAAAQAAARQAVVVDVLRRVGRFDAEAIARWLRPLVRHDPSDRAQWGRRRLTVALVDGVVTLSAARSHDRVTIAACPATHPTLDAFVRAWSQDIPSLPALPALPTTLRGRCQLACDDRPGVVAATGDLALAEALAATGRLRGVIAVVDGAVVFSAGDPTLVGELTAGALPGRSDAGLFAQATRGGGAAIRDLVLAACDPQPDDVVLELFGGSGHLTLPLASRVSHVTSIEGDARATTTLRKNLDLLPDTADVVAHTGFIDAAAVQRWLREMPRPPTVVVVDPPRTGMVEAGPIWAQLRAAGVQRLVMVSCDAATGARDLRAAVDAGFEVSSLTPIEAFPRTHHLEWVVGLQATTPATATTTDR